jgi:hypothetical protein
MFLAKMSKKPKKAIGKGTPITSFLSSRYSSTVRIFYAIYWLNYNICKLSTFSAPVFSIYCVSIIFAAPDTHQDLGITKYSGIPVSHSANQKNVGGKKGKGQVNNAW